jgi:hypothetical protein
MGLADVLIDQASVATTTDSSVSSSLPPFSILNLTNANIFHSHLQVGGELTDHLSFTFVYEAFYLTCKKSYFCSYTFIFFFIFSFVSLSFFVFKCVHACQTIRQDLHRAFRSCYVKQRCSMGDEPSTAGKNKTQKKSKISISNTTDFNAVQKMLDVSF